VSSLDLSDNLISDVTPLSTWQSATQLAGLGLANNRVTDISALAQLTALSRLDLSGNQLADLTRSRLWEASSR